MIDEHLARDERIESELAEDEQLVWTGKPDPNIAARYERNGPLIGAGLILFDLLVMGGVIATASSPTVLVFVALILLSSLPFAWREISKPSRARAEAGRTVYAITDRRCIVIRPLPNGGHAVDSFGPQALGGLRTWKVYPGGDVLFSDSARVRHMGAASSSQARSDPVGFLAVSEPLAVERLIRETLLVASPETPNQ